MLLCELYGQHSFYELCILFTELVSKPSMERLSAPISSSTTRRLPNGGSNFKEDQSLCGGKGDGGGEDSYKMIPLSYFSYKINN